MTTLINGAPIDDTGKLLVTTATPLPTWPFLGGWAYDPVTVALAVKDAVPAATDPWNNGIRNTSLGQVYVITTLPSPVYYVHGLAISGDGRLFMSSGAPIGSAPGGWPIAGDGGIAGSGLAPTASFFAPLMTTLVPTTAGNPTFTFARAALAYAMDFEGILRQSIANEARFQGARRVRNYALEAVNTAWTSINAITITTGVADPLGGTTAFRLTMTAANPFAAQTAAVPAGSSVRNSMWVRRAAGVGPVLMYNGGPASATTDITSSVTSAWQRIATPVTACNGTETVGINFTGATIGDAIDVWHPQGELVDGQSNQAPSEYVSVGVLAAPYHGNWIDGVKYFNTTNGNSVGALNLALQSQTFNNAYWTKDNFPVTPDTQTAPDGTLTADVLTDNAVNNWHRCYSSIISISNGPAYTFSVYLKAITLQWVQLQLGVGGRWANFNIATGAVGFSGGGTLTTKVTDVGNGWFRCSISALSSNTVCTPQIQAMLANTNGIDSLYVGSGQSLAMWGAQLEQAATAGGYSATTTVAAQSPVVTEAAGTAIPLATTLGYVAENAATNICLQSQDFNTTWSFPEGAAGGTITPNTQTAPDGTLTADVFTDTATSGLHRLLMTAGITFTAAPWTFSLYVKQGTMPWIQVFLSNSSSTFWSNFNLATGAVGNKSAGVTTAVQALPNGWYRFAITITGVVASGNLQIYSISTDQNAGAPTYVGTGQTMYLWGAQVEQASDPSSYIPTTTAAVSRVGDLLQYPWLSNVDGVVGSAYSEVYPPTPMAGSWQTLLFGTALSNAFMSYHASTKQLHAAGSPLTANARVVGAVNRNAQAWSGATCSGVLNGGAAATGVYTPANYPNSGNLAIGHTATTFSVQGCTRNVNIYATRLTDAQLIALTTIPIPDPIFFAPLTSSLIPTTAGNPTPTFNRNNLAYVSAVGPTGNAADGELLILCAAQEARFAGARRVSQGVWSETYADGSPIPAAKLLGYVAENLATNMLARSQEFDNAAWGKNNATAPNDPTTPAPDGTLTADRFIDDATNSFHRIFQNFTSVAGSPYTFSVYVKAGTLTWVQVALYDVAHQFANFNLITGAIGNKLAGTTATITALPNGWWRCSVTFTYTTSSAGSVAQVFSIPSDLNSQAPAYVGTGQTMYLWGAQVEQASDASSYIPTTTGAVSRVGDALSYPVVSNIDCALATTYTEAYTIADAAIPRVLVSNSSHHFQYYENTKKLAVFTASGIPQTANTRTLGAINKNATAWSGATVSLCLNGGAVAGAAFTADPTSGNMSIACYGGAAAVLQGSVRNVKFWNTRLIDEQLKALTT